MHPTKIGLLPLYLKLYDDADFLAEYSRLGGTHHLAVTYAKDTKPFERFGALMGWDVAVIR